MGVYRFWRDLGYAVGALITGIIADLFGMRAAIEAVAVLTFLSGLQVIFRMRETLKKTTVGTMIGGQLMNHDWGAERK
jgi:predicted MFS family arabinose efflux permease